MKHKMQEMKEGRLRALVKNELSWWLFPWGEHALIPMWGILNDWSDIEERCKRGG